MTINSNFMDRNQFCFRKIRINLIPNSCPNQFIRILEQLLSLRANSLHLEANNSPNIIYEG